MNRILTVLRTPGAMLAALVLALIAQLEHTAQVFMLVVGATGWQAQLHAYSFALAVETAVLLFVLAGHKRISYAFAVATFATNLSYYAMAGVDLLSVQGAPAWLMSLLLPAAIMGYSHTIAERGDSRPHTSTTMPLETPVARSEGMTGHSSETVTTADDATEAQIDTVPPVVVLTPTVAPAPARKRAPVVRKRKVAKLNATQRRDEIARLDIEDVSAIVAQFGVSPRTAQNDIAAVRAATLAQNGSAHNG